MMPAEVAMRLYDYFRRHIEDLRLSAVMWTGLGLNHLIARGLEFPRLTPHREQ